MLKAFCGSLLFFFCLAQFASAKIWIADANPGDTGADFKTIQAAHDGASAGDTIYCIGSAQSLGDATFTKKLTIIGPGYFLTENTNLQANPSSAKLGVLTFDKGSEGSMISGCEIQGGLDINTSNIYVIRDFLNIPRSYGYGITDIAIASQLANVYVQDNFITNGGALYGTGNGISTSGNDGPVFVTNNYIGTDVPINFSSSDNAVIENNVINGNVACYNSTFQNNIMISGSFSGSGNGIFNNICNSNQFTNANGNIPNTDTSAVFVNTGTTDGRYQLKAGSPAKGAGVGGVDIGMFAGMNPYVLSGVPPIPSIFYFTAPFYGSKSQGLQVHIKAKVNN